MRHVSPYHFNECIGVSLVGAWGGGGELYIYASEFCAIVKLLKIKYHKIILGNGMGFLNAESTFGQSVIVRWSILHL